MKKLNFNNFTALNTIWNVPIKYKDYFEPHPLQGRKPLPSNVQQIKNSIATTGNFTQINPVIVVHKDGKFLMVDGQNRKDALVEQGLDIPVLIVPEELVDDNLMIVLNTNKRNWTDVNFGKHYATKGKKVYKEYINYLEKYDVTAGVLVAIFYGHTGRRQEFSKAFKEGKLTNNNPQHVEFTLLRLESLKNTGKNPPLTENTRKKQQFQQAMLQAFDNPEFNFEKFKKGLAKVKHCLNKLAKQTDMLKEIYRIEKKG